VIWNNGLYGTRLGVGPPAPNYPYLNYLDVELPLMNACDKAKKLEHHRGS